MDASAQVTHAIGGYLEYVRAAEDIMRSLDSFTPLETAAPSLWTFTDSRLETNYGELMDMMDQRVEEGQSSSEEPHEGGSAAAPEASSSGSRGTGRGTKRSAEEVEYPQWQLKGGKQKPQWQAYEKKIMEIWRRPGAEGSSPSVFASTNGSTR